MKFYVSNKFILFIHRGASVEHVCQLEATGEAPIQSVGAQVWSVAWAPEQDSKLITLANNRLSLWDIQESGRNAKVGEDYSKLIYIFP